MIFRSPDAVLALLKSGSMRDYEEFKKQFPELAETNSEAAPEPEESEDRKIQREQQEALDSAHESRKEAQEEAGSALAVESWSDWKRAPFQ